MEGSSITFNAKVDEGLLIIEAEGEMFVVAPSRLGGLDLEKAEIHCLGDKVWLVSEGHASEVRVIKGKGQVKIVVDNYEVEGSLRALSKEFALFTSGKKYSLVGKERVRSGRTEIWAERAFLFEDVAVLISKKGIEVIKGGKHSVISKEIEVESCSAEQERAEEGLLIRIKDKRRRFHISVSNEGEVRYGEEENPFYR